MILYFDANKVLDTTPIGRMLREGENAADLVTIRGGKMYGTTDLSEFVWKIVGNYLNYSDFAEQDLTLNVAGDELELNWLPDEYWTAHPGPMELWLEGTSSTGSTKIKIVGSQRIVVLPAHRNAGQVVLNGFEKLLTAVTNAVLQATDAVKLVGEQTEAAKNSADAAATSAGQAKQYAEDAKTAVHGYLGWYATPQALDAAYPSAENGNWAVVGSTDTVWVWDSDSKKWRNSAQNSALLTVTAPAAGWVSGSYAVAWDDGTSTTYAYRNRVTVEGVTADSQLAVSQRTQPTDAVCQIAALEPGAGVVDFYADSAPTSAAVFVLEGGQ